MLRLIEQSVVNQNAKPGPAECGMCNVKHGSNHGSRSALQV